MKLVLADILEELKSLNTTLLLIHRTFERMLEEGVPVRGRFDLVLEDDAGEEGDYLQEFEKEQFEGKQEGE